MDTTCSNIHNCCGDADCNDCHSCPYCYCTHVYASGEPDAHDCAHALRPVGSDGQRLAINKSHGERLPGGNEAPRDVHAPKRRGDGHGHHASRAEHDSPDGQPEWNDVPAGDAGTGRDRDRDTAGRNNPMSEPAKTSETPSQKADRIYAEQHPEARAETLYALLGEWADEVHIHTDDPCDVGPSCLMCRTAAALKKKP